ncbi:hypothetical protein Ac2012v2_000818 [Leucoagaricus gongylophorus]
MDPHHNDPAYAFFTDYMDSFPAHFYPQEPHGALPPSHSPPPPSPPISGSDSSADGLYQSNSSPPSRSNSLLYRSSLRYHPTPSPPSPPSRRRSRSRDSDDEMGLAAYTTVENLAHTRKEATRRQRIEAEQRRRDELRDGYAKLKDVLPVSNQKSSKVSLLERATNHIVSLEKSNQDLKARINTLEQEMDRLRAINEKISLGHVDLALPLPLSHQLDHPLSTSTPPASATTTTTTTNNNNNDRP